MTEAFPLTLLVLVPIAVLGVVVVGLIDARWVRRHGEAGTRFWVRGDAAFAAWWKERTDRTIVYAKRLVLVIADGKLRLRVPHSAHEGLAVDLLDVHRVSLERFSSRAVMGRGVRVHLRNGASFCVRAEWTLFFSALAPARYSQRLADELARAVREAKARAEHPTPPQSARTHGSTAVD